MKTNLKKKKTFCIFSLRLNFRFVFDCIAKQAACMWLMAIYHYDIMIHFLANNRRQHLTSKSYLWKLSVLYLGKSIFWLFRWKGSNVLANTRAALPALLALCLKKTMFSCMCVHILMELVGICRCLVNVKIHWSCFILMEVVPKTLLYRNS